MHACGPGLADRLEDLLDELELVRGERVVLDEIVAVLEVLQGHPTVAERELALEDVAFLFEDLLEVVFDLLALGQQSGLDDFIDVGTGEREAGLEAALNL